ncbi:fadF [Corynebacterium phocae]|uniref:FadF n=1 Tax=Corynebacterium phocae TaxID=161895 RepID=A0A1L7D780_9CORY|nr:fadF [Corynebacterium phocae]KAA8721752.1 (Fe-S)-binding protein [Corynebacterium phocae]
MFGWIAILASLPVWGYFFYRAWKMYAFISSGGPNSVTRTDKPARRLKRVIVEVFGHTHFKGRPFVNAAHWAVMVGFLFGIVVWFEAYIQTFAPARGWPLISNLAAYHLVEEVLAIATVLGISFLAFIRWRKPARFENSQTLPAILVEAIVFSEGLGMLFVKAAKIAAYGHGHMATDFVSLPLSHLLPASPALVSGLALFKLLTGLAFIVAISRYFTWGVMWHRFLAFFNIFFQRNPSGEKALGKLPTPDLEEDVTFHSWKMLLDSTTCTECGRCQDLCPAWNTDKPLSPKKFMTDLRDAAVDQHANLNVLNLTGVIDDDVLWSCTNCGACVDQCPVDIEHIDHISDLRRFKVLAESDFPSELTSLFKNIENKGNPWGRNNSERRTWIDEVRAQGIEVPIIGEDDFTDMEYLFWVGCAGAYDDAARATTKATVQLLHTAGVKFGVLATGETCTGDPARRAGHEFLFQMMAQQNVETLNSAFSDFDATEKSQRKIITTCAHCFNTIRNEYPDFDGHFEVFHHTQLLNRLVREGLLKPVPRTPNNRKPITYHDPCFLGRHNKVYDPPRELLEATGVQLREMDQNKETAMCCGAGGARMFMEEKQGQRINEVRSAQAVATGAEEVATGCPFCNVMFTGGLKAVTSATGGDSPAPRVNDVAIMLRNSITDADGNLPTARPKAFLGQPVRRLSRPQSSQVTQSPTPTAPKTPVAPKPPAPAPAAPVAPAPAVPTPPANASTTPAPPAAPAGVAPAAPAPGVPAAPTPPAPPKPPAPPAGVAPAAPTPPVPPAAAPPAGAAPAAPTPPAPGVPTPPQAPVVAPAVPTPPAAPTPPAPPTGVAPAVPAVPSPPAAPTPPAVAAPPAGVAPAAPTVPTPPAAPTPPPPPAGVAPPQPPAAAPAPPAGAAPAAPTPPPPAVPAPPAAPPAPGIPLPPPPPS